LKIAQVEPHIAVKQRVAFIELAIGFIGKRWGVLKILENPGSRSNQAGDADLWIYDVIRLCLAYLALTAVDIQRRRQKVPTGRPPNNGAILAFTIQVGLAPTPAW